MGFTIAVDGPAASGKGTISKRLARDYGFGHLDTGRLYRAVGRRMLDGMEPVEAARTLNPEELDDAALRLPEVAQAASRVATIAEVRAALVDFQRAVAARSGGAVLDGRDIGTVICPDAPAKLFVTARPEIRADRRWRELVAAGHDVSFDGVLDDIRRRDDQDMNRADAPLRAAETALVLDTSDMDIDTAVATARRFIDEKRPES
ncbi:(d)CMP kinase [Citreimonas sp.]|uniref:(d)CMP kinase n=1 Tax=Citreimonas sp. TaxID=3036715 RepID=UPI00405815D9